MKMQKITTMQQLWDLVEGNLIIVRWDDYFVKHHEGANSVMAYRIADVKRRSQLEIICQTKDNHYFSADRYLDGLSHAQEVCLVKEVPEPVEVETKYDSVCEKCAKLRTKECAGGNGTECRWIIPIDDVNNTPKMAVAHDLCKIGLGVNVSLIELQSIYETAMRHYRRNNGGRSIKSAVDACNKIASHIKALLQSVGLEKEIEDTDRWLKDPVDSKFKESLDRLKEVQHGTD